MILKIVIADTQEVFREGLTFMIEQDSDLLVVGCADDGSKAVELCGRLLPDIALLDMELPVYNGVECVRLMKTRGYSAKVILLATFYDARTALEVLQNEADGYVLKDIKPDKLRQLIKDVAGGHKVIGSNSFQTIVTPNQGNQKSPNIHSNQISALEATIIRCILIGKSNGEIAALLNMNETSIENVVSDLLRRFQFKDRMDLLVYMVKENRI